MTGITFLELVVLEATLGGCFLVLCFLAGMLAEAGSRSKFENEAVYILFCLIIIVILTAMILPFVWALTN